MKGDDNMVSNERLKEFVLKMGRDMEVMANYGLKIAEAAGSYNVTGIMQNLVLLEGSLDLVKSDYNELAEIMHSMESYTDPISTLKKSWLAKLYMSSTDAIRDNEEAVRSCKESLGIKVNK